MGKDEKNINLNKMEKENLPFSTSTPKHSKVHVKILREKQPPNLQHRKNAKYNKNGATEVAKPPKPNRSSNVGSENPSKPNRRSLRIQQKLDEEKAEVKRRQQAVEAMRVLEQRRLRMIQEQIHEDTALDDLAHLSMNVSPIRGMATTSANPAEDKKRLQLKAMKRQRVMEYLTEQEARKNFQMMMMMMPPPPIPPPSFGRKSKGSINQAHRIPRSLPVVTENCVLHIPRVKYSKDELRALNPYGYYFM